MLSKTLRNISIMCILVLITNVTTLHSRASITDRSVLHNVAATSPFELVGHIGGVANALAIQDHYAYVGFGPELVVFDLADPNYPVLLGSVLLPDIIYNIAINFPYAYISDYEAGLQIVNIANPTAMTIVGSAPGPQWANGVAVYGDYVYMGGSTSDLRVYNVSNPSTPQEVNSLAIPAMDIQVVGQYAYVASLSYGLQILSLANPALPTVVGQYGGSAERVTVVWPLVYITGFVFVTINVSDPANPYLVGQFWNINGPIDVAANDMYAYTLNSTCLVDRCETLLTVTGLVNPIPPGEGELTFLGRPSQLAIYGSYIVLTNGTYGGISLINISNPNVPVAASQYRAPGNTEDLYVSGSYVYTIMNGGIQVVDISNPVLPVPLGFTSVPGEVRRVAVDGSYAYITSDYGGLIVIYVADPNNIFEVGVDTSPINPWGIAAAGSYAYVGAHNGFMVEDVSDPSNPVFVGSSPIPGSIGIALRDHYALSVTCYGLDVIDISNPLNPVNVAPSEPGNCTSGQAIGLNGNYAYLAHDGYKIINIADPLHPVVETTTYWGFAIFGIAIDNQLSYLATSNGIDLVDLTDPIHPEYIGNYGLPDDGNAVKASNGYIYLADGYAGIYVFRVLLSDIRGRVMDASSNPVSGVTISADSEGDKITGADGSYLFEDLLAGDYTITPTLSSYVFYPTSHTVNVPPDATGQNFILLPEPVQTTLTPGLTTTLSFVDLQGSNTQVIVPGNAISDTLTLTLIPTYTVGGGGFAFTGHAFDMLVSQGGIPLPGFTFNTPITVTVEYSNTDIRVIADESGLALWWKPGVEWFDATQSCEPPSAYTHDLDNYVLSVPVCQVGKYGLFGPTNSINLPLVIRTP